MTDLAPCLRPLGATFVIACLALLGSPNPALATATTVGPLTFDVPANLTPVSGRPAPIAASWRSDSEPLSIDVVISPLTASSANEAAKEYSDWPGVGRSMAAGFGDSAAKALGRQLGVSCTYTGVPVANDRARPAIRVMVETTCATKPEATGIQSHVIAVITKSAQVLIRLDARAAAYASAESIASRIWNSLTVTPAERVVFADDQKARGVQVAGRSSEPANPDEVAAVAGGPGLRFPDYRLMRPAAILAKSLGSLVAAFVFGALFTLGLMRIGLRPTPALVASQVAIFLLAMWGESHDGLWEIDWLQRGIPAVVAVLSLRSWAQRRWDRRNPASRDAGHASATGQ